MVPAGNAPNDATAGITAIVWGRTGPAACACGRTVFVGPWALQQEWLAGIIELPHCSAMWWQHSRSAGVMVTPGRTHAMAGVFAHSREIVSSANARVLVTLMVYCFRWLRRTKIILPTTILVRS